MDIGKRIRALREERGLTQREVARRAGLTPSGVGFIEHGQTRNPSAETVVAVARALGVPVEELLREPVPLDEAPGKEPRLEGTMITFPEGAVDEVVKLHKQGKLSKADVREAIGKLTDLALENATEEIEEYMAEMAARVKEAHGDRPK